MSSLRTVRAFASVFMVSGLLAISGCHTGGKDCCSDGAKETKTAPATTPSPDKKSEAPAAAPAGRIVVVNTICPIGGDDFETKDRPASLARTVNSQSVGFCCDHCTAKFDKMDAKGQEAVLKAAMANKQM